MTVVAAVALIEAGLPNSTSIANRAPPAYQPAPSPGILRPTPPAGRYYPGTGAYIYTANRQDGDNDPDVLLFSLLTVGAGVLALIGYVVRNRVGFWLHRPPPREGGAPEEHH